LLTGQPVEADDHDALPRAFEELMRAVGAPAGLREIGYDQDDLPELVAGAVKQQRLLVCAPCHVTDGDLEAILRASL
jgi:alcohol dehydrogenase class IV